MTTPATVERHELCDLLDELGPNAPTLCDGWRTVDLAAHLVMRERRPDGAIGILVKPLAGYADKVQARIASWPWPQLIEHVRSGPPRLSPTSVDAVDRAVNTVEFFVHHEDVRRAQPEWSPRDLDGELVDDLYTTLKRGARLLTRKAPAGIELEPSDGHPPIVANRKQPTVTVRGPVGELTLFVYGRQANALVELDGQPDAVASVGTAPFGI
ncbi:MAG: TIGR03085 family metal-binding protein [Ilumatobacteraceae bacterium]